MGKCLKHDTVLGHTDQVVATSAVYGTNQTSSQVLYQITLFDPVTITVSFTDQFGVTTVVSFPALSLSLGHQGAQVMEQLTSIFLVVVVTDRQSTLEALKVIIQSKLTLTRCRVVCYGVTTVSILTGAGGVGVDLVEGIVTFLIVLSIRNRTENAW
mgnify:CR=1 FL=1